MLTFSISQEILNNALKIEAKNEFNISVAVVDSHGELLSFARMDDASLQSGLLAQNKAYTSARERQPSGNLGQWAQSTGKDMGYWTDSKITGLGGAIPIKLNGQHAGAIGVCGLSEQQDEQLAIDALAGIGGIGL